MPRLVRAAFDRLLVAELQRLGAAVVANDALPSSLLVKKPHASVRPHACIGNDAWLRRNRSLFSGLQLVTKQLIPALVQSLQEQGRAIRPPALDGDVPRKLELEIVTLARFEVPECGTQLPFTFVLDHEDLLARNGRPALRSQCKSMIRLFAHGRSGARVDHAQRGVDQVAVLRVLEAEQRAVGRQPALAEAATVPVSDMQRFVRAVKLGRRAACHGDVNGKAVTVAEPERDDTRRLRQAFVPPVRNGREEGSRLAACEGLREPAAGLVAGVVCEPEDLTAIERRGAVRHPDRLGCDLAPLASCRVPREHLPDACLVRCVDTTIRRVGRPGWKERDRRAEAALPECKCFLCDGHSVSLTQSLHL